MKPALLVIYLLLVLGGSVAFMIYIFGNLGWVEMSIHGWIALGLGVVVSLALGIGLMMLSYHSHRRGYDDDAHGDH